jgi:hypothetical protein
MWVGETPDDLLLITVVRGHPAQTKSFDAEVVEAQGYKSAVLVADELMGLLDGSKRVDTLKDKGAGAEQLTPFTAVPQVRHCTGLHHEEL